MYLNTCPRYLGLPEIPPEGHVTFNGHYSDAFLRRAEYGWPVTAIIYMDTESALNKMLSEELNRNLSPYAIDFRGLVIDFLLFPIVGIIALFPRLLLAKAFVSKNS